MVKVLIFTIKLLPGLGGKKSIQVIALLTQKYGIDNLRILLLSCYYTPDFSAGSFRAEALVKAIQEHTSIDSAFVLTTKPHRYGRKDDVLASEKEGKIKIVRCTVPQHGNRLYRQLLTFLVYATKLFAKALSSGSEFDLILTTGGRLGTNTIGHAISRVSGKPHFVEMRDIFSDNIKSVFTPSIMTRFIIRMLEKWEKNILHQAQWINFVSPGFLDYFPNDILSDKTRIYTNGIDPIFIEKRKQILGDNKQKTKNTCLRLVYAGNIGLGQRLEKIIIPLALRFPDEIEFILIGNGNAARILNEDILKKQITNITIVDPVPREKLIEYYYGADVLFVHLADIPAFSKSIPSKLFEYASTNKPILAGLHGVSRNMLETEVSHAYLFDPGDVDGAAVHITKLMAQPINVDRTEFVTKYSREKIMRDMIQDIVTAYAK